MIRTSHGAQRTDDDRQHKWFNSPVTFHEGSHQEIRAHLPSFERRGFGLTQAGGKQTRLNEHLDIVVRLPFREDRTFFPIGVVSKDYVLVPHTTVLDVAIQALDEAQINLSKVELMITQYGERMALSLYFSEDYSFDPGDGNPMTLRLECFNSVDGSTRFRALMGWFRFVCSNGLIIGVTRYDMDRRHVGDLQIQDISKVLTSGIKEAETEKKNFERWHKTPISSKNLAPWVDSPLRKEWGFKAATRFFHIAHTGADVDIIGQYKGSTPTTIAVQVRQPVPGAPKESQNLYDVSQILAWLAKERRDIQEQLEWREAIPGLMASLEAR
jgi:hypothetical protein